ncbi:3-hydroxybutyryl-CoA dehydrogenase [Streptomyces sulfonofaciens]|uniref:3-hydroxybutyryl-CoA dehydrogenase n=1 Tax=Streptomyces sulfonofaciens TaxID=68272 RepID=A0A919FU54_9ACTN|nr:3-hydroxyacyl-CoA dehydrogenase family protein [Streptomyces sulfonofaciens]GHH72488.1 3-hydroxybutyryl-CoA dehydrogenase [Streptomyces sulfonofaciens]
MNQSSVDGSGAQPTAVGRAAVVGSGYMGGGIAQVLALAGIDVVLGDVDAERAEAARRRLIDEAARFVERGLFEPGAVETITARLSAAESIEAAVAGVDYVTEAVFESREVKKAVLARVSGAAAPSTIIGSNTSAIPIEELAAAVVHPERFLGVHWMNPAPFVPGVELIPAAGTAASAVDTAEALVAAAGKNPARVSDSPGFVANRLQFALYKEAVRVVEEGLATPEQIDTVVSNTFGFRLALFGPFAIGDMAGLDVYAASYESLAAEYGERLAAPELLTETVRAGHLGLKSGRGFLDVPADEAAALVAYRDKAYAALSALRKQLGPAPGR